MTISTRCIFLFVAVLLAILQGCISYGPTFARHAVEYNKTLEAAGNGEILLNVLRARDRLPMYFTAISQVQGRLSTQLSAGASATINDGSRGFVAPEVGVNHTANPFFNVGPLNTQEFMQGILKPIDMELFEYYWEQGRTRNMLMYLFIRKIEFGEGVTIDGATVSNVENLPEKKTRMEEFEKVITYLRLRGLRPGIKKKPGHIDATVKLTKVKLDDLVKAHQSDLSVKLENGHVQLSSPSQSVVFCFGRPNPEKPRLCDPSEKIDEQTPGKKNTEMKESTRVETDISEQKTSKYTTQSFQTPQTPTSGDDEFKQMATKQTGVEMPDGVALHIHPRSVQGILYYLGEIVRTEQDDNRIIQIVTGKRPNLKRESLFRLISTSKLSKHQEYLPKVAYRGEKYIISEDDNSQSLNVLSLVSELLALLQKGEGLPKTETAVVSQ